MPKPSAHLIINCNHVPQEILFAIFVSNKIIKIIITTLYKCLTKYWGFFG